MINTIIVLVAQYFLYIIIGVAVIIWLKLQSDDKKRLALILIGSGLLALLLAKIGAWLYFDARPFTHPGVVALFSHRADNGFPSDHTLLATVIAASVYLFRRRSGMALLGLAALVGAARVLAHVHSPVDIVGAMLIGLAAVAVVRVLIWKFWPDYAVV